VNIPREEERELIDSDAVEVIMILVCLQK
jgi:hypothetical protein